MNDPHYYCGSDDRDGLASEPICDECPAILYPEELASGRCRRCTENALDAGEDGEDFRGDEAEGYAFEQHEAERSLK